MSGTDSLGAVAAFSSEDSADSSFASLLSFSARLYIYGKTY
jgi:hypothetical protein